MTVRKAINNLVNEGILFKVPHTGTFVNKTPKLTHSTIGFFLDKTIKKGISSAYYSMIFNAIEKEAALHNHSVVYFSDVSDQHVNVVLKKIDGVIATCFPHNETVIQKLSQNKPIVTIDNTSADASIPSVVIDNYTAVLNAVKHLHQLNLHSIGFVSGLTNSDVGKQRLHGFRAGMKKYGLDINGVFDGNYSFESGIAAAQFFMAKETLPQAIICANDRMALGVIQHLQQHKFYIPEDISIIGFDNIQAAAQVFPSLTTNAVPFEQIAQESFTMLKQLIEAKPLSYQHLSLPAHLIIRNSCLTAHNEKTKNS